MAPSGAELSDLDRRRLRSHKGPEINRFFGLGGLADESRAFPPELAERSQAARLRSTAAHGCREGLTAVFLSQQMILDGDRGRELIDPQSEAARALGKQRIIRRQAQARRQLQIALGAGA